MKPELHIITLSNFFLFETNAVFILIGRGNITLNHQPLYITATHQ